MIRPILPKYLWDRIDRNLTVQGKGRVWEVYKTLRAWEGPVFPSQRVFTLLTLFNWKTAFESEWFWIDIIKAFGLITPPTEEQIEEIFHRHNIKL